MQEKTMENSDGNPINANTWQIKLQQILDKIGKLLHVSLLVNHK